jgi:glycosyltransferase involved in cell wall biosynthesis
MKISVAFTAKNEADLILTTLSDSVRDMDAYGSPYEIIVVDNASTDDTAKLAEEFAATHPAVRVVRHPQNLGYAHSNLTAFKNATGDVVAVLDSDGQQTVRDIPKAIAKIEAGADVVFGWRKDRHDSLMRKMISAGLSVCARSLLRYPFHDINTGFRVVTAKVAKSFQDVVPVNFFGPELWARTVQNGWTCDEIIVEHFERKGGTSIHIPWRMPITIKKAYDYLKLLQKQLPPNSPWCK